MRYLIIILRTTFQCRFQFGSYPNLTTHRNLIKHGNMQLINSLDLLLFIYIDISKLNVEYCLLRSVSSHIQTSQPLHFALSNSEFKPFITKDSKVKYCSTSNHGKCFALSPDVY